MSAIHEYKDGEAIEVDTPTGWKPGTYMFLGEFNRHIVECPDMWYGAIAVDDERCIRPVVAP